MKKKKLLTEYLQNFKILSDKQYGFRHGKSTLDPILNLTTAMYSAVDDGSPAICVFVDLARAFDTVNHQLLSEVLEHIGIRGVCRDLFSSYLSDRRQCVRINGILSEYETIKCGVPQGTILGPILFNIYIDNLFHLMSCGDIFAYADDTAIFYTDKSWIDLKTKIEKDMENIKSWFDSMYLSINFDKTVYLPIMSSHAAPPPYQSLSIGNHDIIKSVQHAKYLGLHIDSALRWSVHVGYVMRKIRSLMGRFKILRRCLTSDQLRIVYTALIEPHITYAIVAWGAAGKTLLRKLEIAQKRIIKIIYDKDRMYPSNELYRETNVFDAHQLYFIHCATAFHKLRISKNTVRKPYKTRSDLIEVPRMRTARGQRSFNYLGVKLYNSLPSTVRYCNSRTLFRRRLMEYVRSIGRDSVADLTG